MSSAGGGGGGGAGSSSGAGSGSSAAAAAAAADDDFSTRRLLEERSECGRPASCVAAVIGADALPLGLPPRRLEKELSRLENQIYVLEERYLDETRGVGNIVHGWGQLRRCERCRTRSSRACSCCSRWHSDMKPGSEGEVDAGGSAGMDGVRGCAALLHAARAHAPAAWLDTGSIVFILIHNRPHSCQPAALTGSAIVAAITRRYRRPPPSTAPAAALVRSSGALHGHTEHGVGGGFRDVQCPLALTARRV